jgi:hypothetical protein
VVGRLSASSLRAFGSSVRVTGRLLWQGRLRLVGPWVDRRIGFADGTSFRVYRETICMAPNRDPCVLVVRFRLRLMGHSALLHALFRAESLANTPLFTGFAGFRTKLWMTEERTGEYRGLYDWDGPEQARAYATSLVELLRLVCVPGSIAFHIEPHADREEYVRRAAFVESGTPPQPWWVPAQPVSA